MSENLIGCIEDEIQFSIIDSKEKVLKLSYSLQKRQEPLTSTQLEDMLVLASKGVLVMVNCKSCKRLVGFKLLSGYVDLNQESIGKLFFFPDRTFLLDNKIKQASVQLMGEYSKPL